MTELSFVSNLYRNVLFREPDTAGTNFWVNQLTLGGASRATVTAAFINSAEADTFVNPIIRLYENILGRAPDAAGLYSWSQALRSGQTLQQITAGFLNSAEGAAAGWSGAGVTGTAFITKLYTAMGRTPAQIAADPSVASWAQALNSGAISPANVAIGINESAENRAATAGFTAGYEALRAAGITQPSTAQAYTFLNTATTANIIASAATVTDNATLPTGPGVVPPVTGEGYLLTNGTDIATANVFTANQVYTPGGNDRINSLQDEDTLTGTGVNPTLNATLGNIGDNGAATITPKLSGIETVNVAFTGSGAGVSTLDLQDATGIKALNVTRVTDPTKNVAINNLTSVPTTVSLSQIVSPAATVAITFTDSAVAGATDSTTVTLNSVTVGSLTIQENATLGALDQGIENLTLTTSGSANSIGVYQTNATTGVDSASGAGLVAQDLVKLTLTGASNLTIDNISNADGSLTTVDASALTGALDINVASEIGANTGSGSGAPVALTVTTGSGNDTIRVGAGLGSTDVINAGAGTDTLRVYNNATSTLIDGKLTNIETLDVRVNNPLVGTSNAAGIVLTADTSLVGGLQNITVRNDGAAAAGGQVQFLLDNVSAAIAGTASNITLRHGTNGNNDLVDTRLTVQLKDGSGTADTVAVTLVNDVNTDLTFSFNLDATGRNAAGVAGAGGVENVTIADNDTETNTVVLTNTAAHTGTVTLTGGVAGQHFGINVDTVNTATFGNFNPAPVATDATVLANLTTFANNIGGGANLVASKIDASTYVGNVAVVLGQPISATNTTGAQTVLLGSGNDLVIFNDDADARAGLTISDVVTGGTGTDTLRIDSTRVAGVNLGQSEFTNVTGFETLQLRGTAGYNVQLTTGLVSSSAFVVDHVERGVANAASTIDARLITGGFKFFGESGYDYTGAYTTTSGTTKASDGTWVVAAETIILNDANTNGTVVIDGGDAVGLGRNLDTLQVRDTAVVSVGDLANVKNTGVLEFRSDAAAIQTYTLELNNTVLDAQDSSQAATTAAPETYWVRTVANTDSTPSADILNVDASNVTNAFNLVIGGGRGLNTISVGTGVGVTSGSDTVVLWGGFAAGTYAGVDESGRDLTVESDFNGSTAGQGTRVVNDVINLGNGGTDTLITYGAINLAGATLTGIETITAHSALVISAAQYRTLISNAGSSTNPVITFTGNTTHQLRIVGDAGAALDLSRISLGTSLGANGSLVIDTTDANGAAMGNAPTGSVVDNSNTGDPVTGTVSTTPANNTILTSATTTFLAGETKTGTAGVSDTFQGTYAALTGTTITGTDADTETLTLTAAAAGAIGGGGAGGTITNIDNLILGNFANTATFGAGTGIKNITGGTGVDTITTANLTVGGTISTGAGADVVTLSGDMAGTTIDLGADNGDQLKIATGLTLTTMTLSGGAGTGDILTLNGGTANIAAATVSGFEVLDLNSHAGATVVTMTLAQNNAFTSLTNDNDGDGITLTTAGTVTALADDGGNNSVIYNLSSAGANIFNASSTATKYIVTGGTGVANTFNFGTTLDANDTITGSGGTDIVNVTGSATLSANVTAVETINFTTSTAAQTLTTGAFATNATGTTITAAASTVGVTINASGVTSANVLTIIDGAGNDTINVSTTVASRATEVVTLSTGGSDTVVINDLVHLAQGQTGVTINNFTTGVGAAADVLRLQFDATNSQANFLGDYTVVTAAAQAATVVNSSTTLTVFEVNQAAASTTSLTDVADGGLVESALATAFGTVTNAGSFEAAVILYGTGAAAGNAGLYSVTFTGAADAITGNMTVELIGVLNGVTADSFVSSNIA